MLTSPGAWQHITLPSANGENQWHLHLLARTTVFFFQ